MSSEDVRFGPAILKRAITEADGRHPSNAPLILSDRSAPGVSIRVTGKSSSWYLRFQRNFTRLGSVGNPDTKPDARKAGHIYSAKDAVEIAGRVREMIRLGQDPADYITARALGHSHDDAAGTAKSIVARRQGAWTYKDLVEKYIADAVAKPKKTSKGRIKPPKAKSVSDVQQHLMYPTTAHMHGRLLRDLTKGDLEKARNEAAAAGRKHPQRKVVTYIKAALTWASDMHGAESGLDDVAPWWLRVKSFDVSTEREEILAAGGSVPVLTVKDVARILFTAEKYRVIPGRELALPTKEVTMAALWWVVLTAQRAHASLSLRIARIEDQMASRGWFLVEWLPMDVKSGRFHSLPISPEIYRRTIGRALAAEDRRPGSEYVFPSPKARVQGSGPDGPEVDKPISDTVLNGLFLRLRGEKELRRKGVAVKPSGIDLLAGVPKFSPHKFRDALASCLTDLELPGGAASAILDHADAEREEDPDSRQAKVTQDHYDRSHKLNLKHRALEAWSSAVITEYNTLLLEERRRRFGRLGLSGPSLRHILNTLAPEDAWLFDRHLPTLPGLGGSRLNLARLRVVGEEEDISLDGPDRLREFG
ncbi:hypothetical protein ACFOYU_06155 [Microvirga sp. GCM10011540]|uniref:hypothetical protein n=1 Tax=Microvirga sp. GCM10011540 TaxID=3317338 RepID=UPI00361F7E74